MISKLKERLAVKMSKVLDDDIKADDICFYRNGCRNDVVRWSVFGYDCYSTAAHSVKNRVKLSIEDDVGWPVNSSIYADPPC